MRDARSAISPRCRMRHPYDITREIATSAVRLDKWPVMRGAGGVEPKVLAFGRHGDAEPVAPRFAQRAPILVCLLEQVPESPRPALRDQLLVAARFVPCPRTVSVHQEAHVLVDRIEDRHHLR